MCGYANETNTGEVYSRKIIATRRRHTYICNIDDTRTKFIRLYKFVASCRRITSICVTEIIVFEERGMSKPRVRGIFGIMGHGVEPRGFPWPIQSPFD